jgi:hypothetical protein
MNWISRTKTYAAHLSRGLHVNIADRKQAQAANVTSTSGTHQRRFTVLHLGHAYIYLRTAFAGEGTIRVRNTRTHSGTQRPVHTRRQFV